MIKVRKVKRSTELADCPFCGREEPFLTRLEDDYYCYCVQCERCVARGPRSIVREKAIELWKQIKNASSYPSLDPSASPYNAVTACLVKLVGGRATSVVPFEAEMNIDVRIPIQFSTSQVFGQLQKIITKYQAANPKVSVKATVGDTVEPFEVNKASPLVHILASSVRKILNKPATLLHKTGTGDMNILGKAMNLPIVTYGPGDSHLDHTLDEHIEIKEYLASIDVYKETLLRLAELHNSKSGT